MGRLVRPEDRAGKGAHMQGLVRPGDRAGQGFQTSKVLQSQRLTNLHMVG